MCLYSSGNILSELNSLPLLIRYLDKTRSLLLDKSTIIKEYIEKEVNNNDTK